MYYNSKSEFYFRQYVLPIIALVFSLGLISSGVYIYWASNTNNAEKQNLVTASNKPVDENVIEISNDDDELKNLPCLELSKTGKITEVKDNSKIIFNYNEKKYELTLIGIDTENAISDLITVIKNDLLNKDVQIAFDNNKTDGVDTFAYIYLDNKLYNEYLLESGITTLKTEQINTAYLSDLKQAQAYAKQLNNGIWAD